MSTRGLPIPAVPPFTLSAAGEFAAVCAQLLALLSRGADGQALSLVLKRAIHLVRRGSVRIDVHDGRVRANLFDIGPEASRLWLDRLASHGLAVVLVHEQTSQQELLHFLVLLSGQVDEHAFHRVWMTHGAWRIEVQAVPSGDTDVSESAPSVGDHTEALDALLRTVDDTGRVLEHAELRLLVDAVRAGASIDETAPVGRLLRAAGAAAMTVFLEALAVSSSGSQRRRLFDAIVTVRDGHTQLLTALRHPQWFVARNAALLLGEIQLVDAIEPLGSMLGHRDVRVRAAVVTAIGQLPTADAEPLLVSATNDESSDVRLAAWHAWVNGRGAPPVISLDRALRTEPDRAVQLALLRCAAAYPDVDVTAALVRFCARELSAGSLSEHLLFAIELLTLRNPQQAKPFVRRLADRQQEHVLLQVI